MQDLVIEATETTPAIRFLVMPRVLEIRGESYPENSAAFYAPIYEWLEDFLQEQHDVDIQVIFEVSYFNSSSSKVFLDLFDLLSESSLNGNNISVDWRYHKDNEMGKEYGEDFQEEVQAIAFRLVEVAE